MRPPFRVVLPPGPLRLGLLAADGITVRPSGEGYLARVDDDLAPMLAPGWVYPDHVRKGIRSLLKAYGFHPSGRNRPASEYLAKDLLDRRGFKAINNVVDINNHVSLLSGLPISVLDLDKAGGSVGIRLGTAEEGYVFNTENQVLALRDLLVLTREGQTSEPIGSPVKDSLATKIFPGCTRVFGAIYASRTLNPEDEVRRWLDLFATLLRAEAGAATVETWLLDA